MKMRIQNSNYFWPVMGSILIHIVFILFLGTEVKFHKSMPTVTAPSQPIVQAITLDEKQIQAEIKKIKHEKESKVLAKKREQQKINNKLAATKKALHEEQLRLKKIREKRAITAKQQKAKLAAEQKALLEMQKKRKIEENKIAKLNEQVKTKLTKQTISRAEQQRIKSEVDKYKAQVIQAISQRWNVADFVDKNIICKLWVKVGPGGVVIDVKTTKSCGDLALDRSARAAVLKASPLPVPTDPKLFDQFRELSLTMRPEGLVSSNLLTSS